MRRTSAAAEANRERVLFRAAFTFDAGMGGLTARRGVLTSFRYEYLFWEMAYRGEQWAV